MGNFRLLSRCVLYLSTLVLILATIASYQKRWSYISNDTLPKQSTEQTYIVRLEHGRIAAGSYPSDIAFRGLVTHDWCIAPSYNWQPTEKFDINLAHKLEGDWRSLPIFRRFNTGRSSLTYFEFPIVYALLPMVLGSVAVVARDTRRFIHSRRMGCRRCGYSLEGLPTNTCPECGTTTTHA